MTGVIQQDKLAAIVERLRTGAALIKESLELGFTHNGPLRTALKAMLGEAGYNDLMQAKRPTTKSGTPLSSVERPRPDDSSLPLLEAMGKTEGWSWRHVSEHEPRPVVVVINKGTKDEGKVTVNDCGERLLIVISPEGKEYIKAFEFEKASILRVNPSRATDPPIRFVEYANSEWRKRIEKNVVQGDEQMKRGEAALERKRNKNNGTEAPPTLVEVAKVKTPRKVKKVKEADKAKAKKPTPKAVKKAVKGKKK